MSRLLNRAATDASVSCPRGIPSLLPATVDYHEDTERDVPPSSSRSIDYYEDLNLDVFPNSIYDTIDYYEDTEHDSPPSSTYGTIDYYEDIEYGIPPSSARGTIEYHENTEHRVPPNSSRGTIDYYEDTEHNTPPRPSSGPVSNHEDPEHNTPPTPSSGPASTYEDTEWYDESVEERAVLLEEQDLIIADAKAAFKRLPYLPWFIIEQFEGKKTTQWRRDEAPKLMALVEPMDDDRRAAFYQMLETDIHRYAWVQLFGAVYDQYPQTMIHRDDPNESLGPPGRPSDQEVARLQNKCFGSWNWAAADANAPNSVYGDLGPMGEVEPAHDTKCPCDDCRAARCRLKHFIKNAASLKDAIKVNLNRKRLWRKVRGKMPSIMHSLDVISPAE